MSPHWGLEFNQRDSNQPVIMVGPGTGIAPFLSYCLEGAFNNKMQQRVIFFGCRNSKKDYLHKDTWEKLVREDTVSELICAFSRDQPHKIYVQTKLVEYQQLVWNLLSSHQAYFFIAGAAQGLSSLLFLYASSGARTAPYLQALLGNFHIPLTFTFR